MIIDIHRHLWSVYERYPQVAEQAARGVSSRSVGEVEKLPVVPDWQETGERLIEEMDGAGVDRSVIFLSDYGLRLGEGIFTVEGENLIHVEVMRRYPDRIIAWFGIDPRRPGAAEAFERAVKEWGVTGLKMHPVVGFFPHDRVAYPLYEICRAHGLPVIFHTGTAPSPLYSRYSQPLQFDEVAADFPDLTVILGHAGGELWQEALAVARRKPNIYFDLSGWQRQIKYTGEVLFAIDRMRDIIGIERILWASDFPALRPMMPLREWVDTFRRLPSLGEEHGFRFDDSDVDAMLGGNAARILKLPQA